MTQSAQDRSNEQMRNAAPMISYPADWFIEDTESMPHSANHDDHEDRLKSTLRAWVARTGRDLFVCCELAFRFDKNAPGVGVDPDVFLVEEPPRSANGDIFSVRTWEPGNHPPILAIEIVSRERPKKDYSQAPRKHDLLGTFELWVFDPELYGRTPEQPSVRFQMFQRETNARLVRTYAGEGPVFSEALDAWVFIEDDLIIISDDAAGEHRWLTLEEEASCRADIHAKRADEEAKRADEEAKRADEERAAKENALARIAELEALLSRQR
jgi:Uma2 family endonuclease